MSGFENFHINSFEQLCINVANEHLQYYFNEHIFLQEENDYQTEGVSCGKVEFQNNEDLIELFMDVRFCFLYFYSLILACFFLYIAIRYIRIT